MGPNEAWRWLNRLKIENKINTNVNMGEKNSYVITDQPRGIDDLKIEENAIKFEKIEKMKKEKSLNKIERTYICQSGEAQDCLPPLPPSM